MNLRKTGCLPHVYKAMEELAAAKSALSRAEAALDMAHATLGQVSGIGNSVEIECDVSDAFAALVKIESDIKSYLEKNVERPRRMDSKGPYI